MTTCKPGAVILVQYPFTDMSGTKKRPAVVLSSEAYAGRYGDVAIMPLTSVRQSEAGLFLRHWTDAGLLKPTWIKPMIATVAGRLVERELGAIHAEDRIRLREALASILDRSLTES